MIFISTPDEFINMRIIIKKRAGGEAIILQWMLQ